MQQEGPNSYPSVEFDFIQNTLNITDNLRPKQSILIDVGEEEGGDLLRVIDTYFHTRIYKYHP